MLDDWKLGQGVKPHIFMECFKPTAEYDGRRNGPFCDWDCSRIAEAEGLATA